MKIYSITSRFINFEGKRQDRKNVEQLKQNNPYNLNIINQRNISQSIDNISKEGGVENAKFLLNVSKNLKYGTNIDLGKTPNHDWRAELNQAAKKSIEKSPKEVQKNLYAQMDKLENTQKPLTAQEREILKLRESIISKVDRKVLEDIKYENVKNFDRNFDYLISSSEMSVAQKLYVMKKLNYFMSPKYKINPQLANKKTQVLAEMVNDMVIDTPESKIPNIKSVNQLQVGSCAAISICRKKLAYEDKANYVDIILSELDDKNYMMVYDISNLGSHKKIPVEKPYIDYDYAMKQGYRILDASALNWMNAADGTGRVNVSTRNYVAFDKTFFDTFTDGHIIADINEELAPEQDYYRALLKAKSLIRECKKSALEQQLKSNKVKNEFNKNINEIQRYSNSLNSTLGKISPNSTSENRRYVMNNLQHLVVKNSKVIEKSDNIELKDYMFIKNEPQSVKLDKVKKFISSNLEDVNKKLLDKNAEEIVDLLENISTLNSSIKAPNDNNILEARRLYKAAAAYRIQTEFGLENLYNVSDTMRAMKLPDRESLICNNMEEICDKLRKGTLNPKVRDVLEERFQVTTSEDLIEALAYNKASFQHEMTKTFDELYKSCMLESRKATLLKSLKAIKLAIVEDKDRKTLNQMAQNLNIKPDKRRIVKELDNLIDIMSKENVSDEDYIYAYNKAGGKNQILDFKSIVENIQNTLLESGPVADSVRKEFNQVNGLPENASREDTMNMFANIIERYNQLSHLTKAFQEFLEVRDENGDVLNTVIPKEVIMKKLEQEHKVISEQDLKALQEKFAMIFGARQLPDGSRLELKDLPKELTTFSKHEKEIFKTIRGNINQWYSDTTRNLDAQYKIIETPLKEQFRQLGVIIGSYWLSNDGNSGLGTRQQIRILESMTDKPYYAEKDGQVAIDKILNSPYSGITATSVYTDSPGMHAQYIADIKPVSVNTKDGKATKNAIFHDNTWGAIEHDNTWRDENGLLRTDYGQNSGGDGGYITGDKYRNGVYADEIIGTVGENIVDDMGNKQYRKLLGSDGEYFKFPMLAYVIVQGETPTPRDIVTSIKYNTTNAPDRFFDDLKDSAKNMTRDEINQKIKLLGIVPKTANRIYDNIEKEVLGVGKFNKGIDTKAKFDALPENNEVKLLFNAYAALNSYYALPDKKQFYIDNLTPKKIADIKSQVHREARKNFDYTFAKSPEIVQGGYQSSKQEVVGILNNFAKDNDLKLTEKQISSMADSLKKIDKLRFDGSLKNTIELMLDSFKANLLARTQDSIPQAKIDDVIENVRAVLAKNMYFNEADMNSVEFKRDNLPYVEKWIDDNFEPTTDKEFVKIFRKLQDMSTVEFKEKYNTKITDSALGIKSITGYDVLNKFRQENSAIQNGIFSLIYNIEYYNSFDESDTKPYYKYSKLDRILGGQEYIKKSFDDTFYEYYSSMKSLTLDKAFAKHSKAALDKYNVFPAYAKVEIEDSEAIADSLVDFKNFIESNIANSQLTKLILGVVNNIRDLQSILDKLDDNSTLPRKYWEKLSPFAIQLYSDFSDDETVQASIQAATSIINSDPKKTTVKEYKELLNVIAEEFLPLEFSPSGESRTSNVKLFAQRIKDEKQYFIMESIEQKSRKNADILLNKWIHATIQKDKNAGRYFSDFVDFYNKHRITLTPEKLFLEYMMMLAKPTSTNDPYKDMTDTQKKMVENVKNNYDTELKSLLYHANLVDLQSILMNAAKEGNLNMVKQELKNTKIRLLKGNSIDLYSEQGLIMMLRSLIEEKELDTAIMFIDQLGLNELAVKTFATKYISFDAAKRIIKKSYNIFDAADKQFGYINREVAKLPNLDQDDNYKEHIIELRDKVTKYCNHTNFRRLAKLYALGLETCISDMEKNPEKSRNEIFSDNLEMTKAGAIDYAKKCVNTLNEALEKFDTTAHLLHSINLPQNSGYEHYIKEYDEKMEELSSYISKYSIDFKNIPISLGDCAEAKQLELDEME